MSERVDYCKRLMKKALIIHDNLGPNEEEEIRVFLDALEAQHGDHGQLVDDATPCECAVRTDIVEFNNKKYCCDCLHFIGEPDAE